jgi:hypothetical protein
MELGQQFEQLPMFVSARDIHDNYIPMDRGGSINGMYGRKLDEAANANYMTRHGGTGSLVDSIKAGGVKTPVHVYHSEGDSTAYGVHGKALFDGHHRVAVAYDQNPDQLVPVVHDDNSTAKYRARAEVNAYKRREAEKFAARMAARNTDGT